MEIKYPNKTVYGTGDNRGNPIGLKKIKMTEEQKSWYEIGFMCGYAYCLEVCKSSSAKRTPIVSEDFDESNTSCGVKE